MTSRIEGWNTDTPTASEAGVKAQTLPLSTQQQQMQLARKQQLVQAMLGQQLQDKGGTQMAGNIAIRKSPFEALSQALAAGMLSHKQKKLDERGAEIAEEYNALGQAEMQKYLDTANGRAAQTLPEGMSGPPSPAIPGDPKRALTEGLMAQHADVRAAMIAKQKEEALMQRMMAEKAAANSTKDSTVKAAQGGGVGAYQAAAPEQQELAGIIFDKESGKPSASLPPDAQFRQGYDARGNLVQTQPQTGKMDGVIKAPTINNNMRVDQHVEKEFDKKVGTGAAEDVLALGKASRQAETTLQGISEARAAMQSGIDSGIAAPFVDTLGRAAAASGLPVDAKKLANNAAYRATIASELAQYLTTQGGGGRGTTDKDMEILKQKYWKLEQTPEGQAQIMDLLERKARRNQQDFRTSVARVREINPTAAQYLDLGLPAGPEQAQPGVPAAPRQPGVPAPQAPAAPMSASEYLKQNRR